MNAPCSLAEIFVAMYLSAAVLPDAVISQKMDHRNLTATEGGALTLTCVMTSTANPGVLQDDYTWHFRSEKGGATLTLEEKTQGLTMQPLYRNQSGRYDCAATNGVNSTVTADPDYVSFYVQVLYLDDHVTVTPKESKTVDIGDKVTLTCQADSVPTATLTWLHQGRILRTVASNEDTFSFTATDCQDSGEYRCNIDNGLLRKFSQGLTQLFVKECAPVTEEDSTSPAGVTSEVEDNVTLPVTATSPARVTLPVTVTTVSGPPEPDKEAPPSSGDSTLWLKVGGGVMALQLCLAFLCLLLCRRRLICCRNKRDKAKQNDEHQYTGLYSTDLYDSSGRRRSQDNASGESTGHYWSIDSADLSWQPQAVQPQDSLSQVSEERGYDIPPPPVCVTSSGTTVLRHQQPWPDCDVTPMDEVKAIIHSNRTPVFKKGEMVDKASSLPRRCRRGSRESDQESEDSESYLACQVVSHGLPPSSLPSHSPTPQGDYLTPVHQDASGERAPPRPHRAPGLALKTEKKPRRSSF